MCLLDLCCLCCGCQGQPSKGEWEFVKMDLKSGMNINGNTEYSLFWVLYLKRSKDLKSISIATCNTKNTAVMHFHSYGWNWTLKFSLFLYFFLAFIYFTSLREDGSYINSLWWSTLVGLEPAYIHICESPTLPLCYGRPHSTFFTSYFIRWKLVFPFLVPEWNVTCQWLLYICAVKEIRIHVLT